MGWMRSAASERPSRQASASERFTLRHEVDTEAERCERRRMGRTHAAEKDGTDCDGRCVSGDCVREAKVDGGREGSCGGRSSEVNFGSIGDEEVVTEAGTSGREMEGAGLGDGMERMLSPDLRERRGLELRGNRKGLTGLSTSFGSLPRKSLFFNGSALTAAVSGGPANGDDRLTLIWNVEI